MKDSPPECSLFSTCLGSRRAELIATGKTPDVIKPFALDLVGRQNIHDANCQFAFYPLDWIYCVSQFHNFRLDSPRSPLFSAGGVPLRRDPSGRAGTDVGNEIDFLVNFHLSFHQDIMVGYSKLFAGSFIEQTGPPGSPELFYLQWQYRW